jgi:hypothetical protein
VRIAAVALNRSTKRASPLDNPLVAVEHDREDAGAMLLQSTRVSVPLMPRGHGPCGLWAGSCADARADWARIGLMSSNSAHVPLSRALCPGSTGHGCRLTPRARSRRSRRCPKSGPTTPPRMPLPRVPASAVGQGPVPVGHRLARACRRIGRAWRGSSGSSSADPVQLSPSLWAVSRESEDQGRFASTAADGGDRAATCVGGSASSRRLCTSPIACWRARTSPG